MLSDRKHYKSLFKVSFVYYCRIGKSSIFYHFSFTCVVLKNKTLIMTAPGSVFSRSLAPGKRGLRVQTPGLAYQSQDKIK